MLFPDSPVISQPSGAAHSDLCRDLCLNSPTSSAGSSLERRLKPPLLIYEPFHTALLPLEARPWRAVQAASCTKHSARRREPRRWWGKGGGAGWEDHLFYSVATSRKQLMQIQFPRSL